MTIETINFSEKALLISKPWQPHVLAELNDNHVKLARFSGEFCWHSHEHEDEMFVVVEGEMTIHFRTHECLVKIGECVIVPKGVEHKPVSEKGAIVLLVEPKTTINTGDEKNEQTHKNLKHI